MNSILNQSVACDPHGVPTSVPKHSQLLQQVSIAAFRQIYIQFACHLRILLEAIQNVDRLLEFGDVDDAERVVLVAYPDFPHA